MPTQGLQLSLSAVIYNRYSDVDESNTRHDHVNRQIDRIELQKWPSRLDQHIPAFRCAQ